MEDNADVVTHLTDEDCWNRLGLQQLGRLVTHVGEVFDIFPVNYVVDGRSIVFRTAEGSKLTELSINDAVLFEAIEQTIRPSATRRVTRLPLHINDPEFARAAVAAFLDIARQ